MARKSILSQLFRQSAGYVLFFMLVWIPIDIMGVNRGLFTQSAGFVSGEVGDCAYQFMFSG